MDVFKSILLGSLALWLTSCGSGDGLKQTHVTIGTGGLTGVYYQVGSRVSELVNKKEALYGLKCTSSSTGGSVANINQLLSGDIDFGMVQSDIQYQACEGKGAWEEKGRQELLCAVFSVHPELVTLVAADSANIATLADLKGKRVNIGNPGSGQRLNAMDALKVAGLDVEADIQASNEKAADAPGMLKDDRIDAFFYTVGHPNGALKEATAGKRTVHFVPITETADLVAANPYYVTDKIPAKLYPNATNQADTPTFGVKATMMSSTNVPDDIVYAITKEVFDNLDKFRAMHPAFELLTKESMLKGLSAPLHPGAIRYYKEAGLLSAEGE